MGGVGGGACDPHVPKGFMLLFSPSTLHFEHHVTIRGQEEG